MPRRGMVKQMTNTVYPCHKVFDEHSENSHVYEACGRPLLELAASGGVATCFCYGQTGSGKTHTMTAIQASVAEDIFGLAQGNQVLMSFFELVGKRCFDLLDDTHTEVFLRAGEDGEMHVSGTTELEVGTTEELVRHMRESLGRRETASTGANATSSRSHAVCRLHIGGGLLTLVDLAGSERKEDSMYHDAERRKEAAEINSSLMALKECIRHRAMAAAQPGKHVHIPYRGSNLTKVLRNSLSNPAASVWVIATASPTVTDTEHTMCTFQSVMSLTDTDKQISESTEEVESWAPPPVQMVPPVKWDASRLQEWLAKTNKNPRAAKAVAGIPKTMNGAQFLRLAVPRLAQMLNGDHALAAEIFSKLRAEVKRIQDEESARRKLIVDDMNKRKNMKSNFAPSFAPKNPGLVSA